MELGHVSHERYLENLLILMQFFSKMIFESFGFTYKEAQGDEPIGTLVPPSVDRTTPTGALNRERLLRAWVEMSAFTDEFRRRYGTLLILSMGPLLISK